MKTRTKIFIFTSAVIGIVITISFTLLYYFLPIVYEQDKINSAKKRADEIAKKLENQPLKKIIEQVKTESAQGETSWRVYDSNNKNIDLSYFDKKSRQESRDIMITSKKSIVQIKTLTIKDSACS